MGDAQPTLLPPSTEALTPATPSGLTPNTRTEAEAALAMNSLTQTESAAPTTPLPYTGAGGGNIFEDQAHSGLSEAQRAYRRPGGPIRTSSTNYEEALQEARKQSSASSNFSTSITAEPSDILADKVSSPVPMPAPGQGVVPLRSGSISKGQSDAVKKSRSRGLSLGQLGRQQSWSEQDFKHLYSAHLMGEVKGDPGYDSGVETSK